MFSRYRSYKQLENFGSLCFSFSFSIMLSVFFLFDVTWNISYLSELARATQKCTFTRRIAIANSSVQFESVKLKLFKTDQAEPNRTTKLFKPNRYKNFKLKPNGFRDFQTFKSLKPQFGFGFHVRSKFKISHFKFKILKFSIFQILIVQNLKIFLEISKLGFKCSKTQMIKCES